MAETSVSFILEKLCKFLVEEQTLMKGVESDLTYIKDELESIQAFLKDADRIAADDERAGANEGVKTWLKQLREACFCIEDVIDEYNIQNVNVYNSSRFIASFHKLAHMIPTMKSRIQIASKIHDIKLSVSRINEKRSRYEFKFETGSDSNYRGFKAARFDEPRKVRYFIEENDVVGFESSRDELVNCLVDGTTDELMLVSIVGMGGLGKTTLAKLVFDNQLVKNHFDFRSFITVSQSYTIRELLIDMISHFCKDNNEPIPKSLQKMDDKTLITLVRQYLESRRYLILLDDVWKDKFYDDIKHVLINNNNGSRIIVTTRIMHVVESFKRYFPVHIHKLHLLPSNKAWELFCNKAFRGQCPIELEDMSYEIVQKCGGLPLAIVAIGGLLSTKPKTMFEWSKVRQNLRMGLERNVHLSSLATILYLSFDDLPYHLKSCMLYFGIYPRGYAISRKRLTRQWIAEGFVKYDEKRTPEEVAEEYLTELIQRSLVSVSKVGFGGKVKSCQVHDLIHDVIVSKMQGLSFCHLLDEDDEQVTVGITRRFSIASISNNVLRGTSNSGIRAVFVFDKEELPKHFMDGLCSKFKLLKVLDFENSLLNCIPVNLGNLFLLKYLNLSHTKVIFIPNSIGKLINLETLDLRQTQVHKLPKEINKLIKLRLLLIYYRKYKGHYSILDSTTGVQMEEGIGCLNSLQKFYSLEADHGGIDLIQELNKLKQLRKLGIRCVRSEYGNALCAAIQKMNHLESLNITAISENEILDLDFVCAPTNLKVLDLKCRLTRLPEWIQYLKYLVKLRLVLSNFEDDPLDYFKDLPNLLSLDLCDDAFSGESLHFRTNGFPNLKELDLTRLNKLISVTIDKEAIPGLECFRFNNNPQLKVLPQGLVNLIKLQFLEFADMPVELVDSIEKGGQCHWIINHVPLVQIRQIVGSKFLDYELRTIPTQSEV